jgi:hypothetical protein
MGEFVQVLDLSALVVREALAPFADVIAVTAAGEGFVGSLAIADPAVMAHGSFVGIRDS